MIYSARLPLLLGLGCTWVVVEPRCTMEAVICWGFPPEIIIIVYSLYRHNLAHIEACNLGVYKVNLYNINRWPMMIMKYN